MSGERIELERTFGAPAERVFDAWTSEEVLRRWFYGRSDLETPVAEVDLRVGGEVRIVMRDPKTGEEFGARGLYREIERPSRLSFTWTWDEEEREMLIEVEFAEVEEGTRVHFTHTNLPDEESAQSHVRGWNTCFDNLEGALAEAA
jgi:uncharacterized protein YndB with AHSA1/START domain